jgi:hypothetical protein
MKKIDIGYCGHINNACVKLVKEANRGNEPVAMDVNEVTVTAKPGDDPKERARWYGDECHRRHEAYLASPEYARRQAELEQEERRHKANLATALENTPKHMTLIDALTWNKGFRNNQDGYGRAVYDFADLWCRLMEKAISNGARLDQCADTCEHLAAHEMGITGFQYGCAVAVIARCWKYGEELRKRA